MLVDSNLGAAQCLRASTFSSFSKCFGNRFFCIFCKPHTYSHPFLPTLVSYKKIWPIYGFFHFSVTKKRAKLGSNLKQLIKENFRFPSSNCDFFLLNTSHTEDMRQKNPNYRVSQKKCNIAIFSLNLFQRSDYTFSLVFRNQNLEPVRSKPLKHTYSEY